MRKLKLPELAGKPIYTGLGGNTKVAPASLYLSEGKRPGDGFGAQWQNYIENALQAQIEMNARVPFGNFEEVSAPAASYPAPRVAHNKSLGMTLFVASENNTLRYYQNLVRLVSSAMPTVTLTPALGTFVPKDVAAMDNTSDPATASKDWVVVGSNASAPTKTIWHISRSGAHVEATSPVSGSVEHVCQAKAFNQFSSSLDRTFALAADTNRSLLFCDEGTTTWSVVGQRGAGALVGINAVFLAVGYVPNLSNRRVVIAYQSGGNTVVESYNPSAFTTVGATVTVETSSTPRDVRWSDVLQKFILLTNKAVYTSSDGAVWAQANIFLGPYYTAGGAGYGSMAIPKANDGGCVHETGVAHWTNGSTGYSAAGSGQMTVQDYLDSEQLPQVHGFGTFPTNSDSGSFVRYDGSALWFGRSESATLKYSRSLRSL